MTPINSTSPALDTWTELSGFQQLRAQARSDGGKSALPAVAKQFEAIFTQMMLKSMRDANASMGSDIAGSEQVDEVTNALVLGDNGVDAIEGRRFQAGLARVDDDAGLGRSLAHLRNQLRPGQIGKAEIKDDDLRLGVAGGLGGCSAILRLPHYVEALEPQRLFDGGAQVVDVFDNESAHHHPVNLPGCGTKYCDFCDTCAL